MGEAPRSPVMVKDGVDSLRDIPKVSSISPSTLFFSTIMRRKVMILINANAGNPQMPDAGSVENGVHADCRSTSLLSLCVIVEKNEVDWEMEDTLEMSRRLSTPSFTITGLPWSFPHQSL